MTSAIAPSSVQVEQICLNGANTAQARALLDAKERRRADEFRQSAGRDQYILGRAALRLVLGEYLGVAPTSIEFSATRHGKPYLACKEPRLRFNLSHSAGEALIALSSSGEVGVDIEALDRPWPDPLARRLLRQGLAYLAGLPEVRRRAELCEFWVRKEAYAKGLGLGIAAAFDFQLPPGGEWTILPLEVGPRHCAAVCARSGTCVLTRRRRLSRLLAAASR